MASDKKQVELIIKANDLSTADLNKVAAAVEKLSNAVVGQVAAAAKGKGAFDELRASTQQLEQAGRALANTQGKLDLFRRQTEQAADLTKTLEGLRQKQADLQRQAAAAPNDKSLAKELAAAERETTRAEKALDRLNSRLDRTQQSLAAAGVDTKNLENEQRRLLDTATRTGASLETLSTAMASYARNAKQARDAEQAQQRLNDFRALADQLDRTAQSYSQLGAAARAAARDSASTEAQDALNPAAGLRRGLEGLQRVSLGNVAAVDAQVNAGGPIRNVDGQLRALADDQRAARALAEQIDAYRTQREAVIRSENALIAARKAAADYAAQIRAAAEPNEQLRVRAAAANTVLANAQQGFVAQSAALVTLENRLREAGVSVTNLSRAQQQLVAVSTQAQNAAERLAEAFATRGGSRGGGPAGFLGLTPYEIQNVAFQVNDFFTQLASGASVTQAFAQQIGQVVQIAPIGRALAAALPFIAAFTTGIAGLVIGLTRLNEVQRATRGFGADQVLRGGAGTFGDLTPERLTAIARAVEQAGASFTEARAAVQQFANLPIPQDRVEALAVATAQYAKVAGVDVPDATQRMARAFAGGSEAVLKLDDEIGFLTAEQRTFIREAQGTEQQAQAMAMAIDAFAARAREARTAASTPLSEALRELRLAWIALRDALADSGAISATVTILRGFADALRDLAAGVRAMGGWGALASIGIGTAGGAAVGGPVGALTGAALGVANIGRVGSNERAAAAAAGSPDPGRTSGSDFVGPPAPISSAINPNAAERTRRTAADAVAEREQEFEWNERIRRGLERNATAEQRRQSIEAAGARAREQFARQYENASAAELQQIQRRGEEEQRLALARKDRERAEGAAARDREQRRRELSQIEEDIRAVQQVRDAQIRDIQESVARGSVAPADALRRIGEAAEQARTRLAPLAEEARRFAAENRGRDGLRDARADSLVASATRAVESDRPDRTAAEQALRTQMGETNRLIQERSSIIQTITALQQQGAITTWDAQDRTRQAYQTTNAEISASIDRTQQLVNAMQQMGLIAPGAFAATNAQLQLFRTQLTYVDPQITVIRGAIQNAFTQGGVQAFNAVAESIGKAVNGMASFGDVLKASGKAALDFFAMFLRMIAQAILQTYALAAAQAVIGAFGLSGAGVKHEGGVVGSGGRSRDVPASWFAGAPRYHTGGVVGLAPNERPIVAEVGEEVLTRDDPRNVLNGGRRNSGGDGPQQSIRNVLVMNEADIADAMAGAQGEKVLINFVRRNAQSIRQFLGG